jgi:hypothetical protein
VAVVVSVVPTGEAMLLLPHTKERGLPMRLIMQYVIERAIEEREAQP